MRTFVIVILCFCMPLMAWGQRAATGPARQGEAHPATSAVPGSHILKSFDFEETRLGNFESVPMYWSKVVGRGYPAYSAGAFDRTVARSTTTSFKLETNGGSVAYRFNPPAEKRIAIHPDADYYILAFVRTSQLEHARADLGAWFADEAGELLPETEAHSLPYTPGGGASGGAGGGAAEAADAWRVLYIYMPGPASGADGDAPRAKSLVLQMGLLQPQQLGTGNSSADAKNGLGRFEIYQQDIHGAVWFDDVVVFQVPRVGIRVPAAVMGGMFNANQPVELDMIVSDLGTNTENLSIRLRVTDAEGVVFVAQQWSVAKLADKSWSQHFTHAPLPAGLYTATLEVTDADQPGAGGAGGGKAEQRTLIAHRQAQFLCLPATTLRSQASHPAPEFGVGLRGWKRGGGRAFGEGGGAAQADAAIGEAAGLWPVILRQTRAGLVQVPAWRRDMSEEALTRRDESFDQLLSNLQRMDVRTIGAFSELPNALATRLPSSVLESDSILRLLKADPAVWRPYFSFSLTRYANRVDSWELGSPETPFSGNAILSMPGVDAGEQYVRLYERIYGQVTPLMSRPEMIIPWNALYEFDAKQYPHAALDLSIPAVIKASQIPSYIANFRESPAGGGGASSRPARGEAGRAGPPIYAHIFPLENGPYSHADRLADFAQRVVFARSCNPEAVLYDLLPMPGSREAGQPDELLLVYRTLIQALGNAEYVGELQLAAGVRAFLFNHHGSGTLVLWNEAAAASEVALDLPLGPTPQRLDLLGNEYPVSVDGATGFARVNVSGTPLILDQLDPRPLQLKSSFRLARATLPAGVGDVRTELILKNPYNEAVSARLRLQMPRGWTMDPPSFSVTMGPGGTLRQPVVIRYPFTEPAGPKVIEGTLSLEQGLANGAQQLEVSFPLAITSDLVEMQGFTQLLDNGDVVIQQMITNLSASPLNAEAYAVLPGYPRQQRYVLGLPAGQTVIKRFTFAAGSLAGANGSRGGRGGNVTAQEVARALVGKSATLGVRQNDGTTLLTKAIPLD